MAQLFAGDVDPVASGAVASASSDIAQIYAAHASFVWASLHRLGIRDADLEDVMQEVFVVVHRKRDTFDGRSKLTTWLFGICMRVASAYRRRGYRRHETCMAEPPEPIAEGASPEADLFAARARETLAALLDELDLERRVVFVMFELEEIGCDEIASVVGVPVGTVYSRLHAARRDFQKALARKHARDAQGGR